MSSHDSRRWQREQRHRESIARRTYLRSLSAEPAEHELFGPQRKRLTRDPITRAIELGGTVFFVLLVLAILWYGVRPMLSALWPF